jgi:erythromycin esterase
MIAPVPCPRKESRVRAADRPPAPHCPALAGDRDLDPLLDRIGDSHVVLPGEASHGTSEFYTWRDRIPRRLITAKEFSFIAVEGDWPDCYTVNRVRRT